MGRAFKAERALLVRNNNGRRASALSSWATLEARKLGLYGHVRQDGTDPKLYLIWADKSEAKVRPA
jgi:hypothetical protein